MLSFFRLHYEHVSEVADTVALLRVDCRLVRQKVLERISQLMVRGACIEISLGVFNSTARRKFRWRGKPDNNSSPPETKYLQAGRIPLTCRDYIRNRRKLLCFDFFPTEHFSFFLALFPRAHYCTPSQTHALCLARLQDTMR